ncbi:hypothetical protein [Deinococcus wulumuqiensis]|uniref:Uncharacterized protein n=1 Tax=Deinococcus wulumuqiensis TaxID=980427 RepID=A0AAV4K9W8_9DEIO|nr:hypothetical protein [Deinococcus wulumuqiensis]QII20068.1 hypothetical protein G6R31_04280 [Deinococcus wulumuqiensis R12]GGI87349.1 hypothetical protein GCM10010914_22300 [Deinococcus wulumuqiensis]GGP30003.1 hypothetical protein GCM10008021_16540 [Deinococcus wulumuqiensis]
MRTLLSLALLLSLGVSAAPAPALCRVEATYAPLSRLSSFGTLVVRLVPGCPPNGTAQVRLGNYGGPGSKATGPTETLSASRPVVAWAAQPHWRTVLWLAKSGKPYPVPIRR